MNNESIWSNIPKVCGHKILQWLSPLLNLICLLQEHLIQSLKNGFAGVVDWIISSLQSRLCHINFVNRPWYNELWTRNKFEMAIVYIMLCAQNELLGGGGEFRVRKYQMETGLWLQIRATPQFKPDGDIFRLKSLDVSLLLYIRYTGTSFELFRLCIYIIRLKWLQWR